MSKSSSSSFLTVKEVAERYQLHPETVRRWIKEGRVPAVRLAGSAAVRIREADLVQIEQSHA